MDFLILIVAACAVVWTLWFVMRGSLVAGCMAALVIGACFGYWFWHTEGGFQLTADRAFIVLLTLTFAYRRLTGGADPKPLGRADWLMFIFVGYVAVSTFTHDWHKQNAQPLAHLGLYWLIPAAVYWIARQSPLSKRNIIGMFVILVLLEIYLVVTGLAEGTGQLWALFPRYIASPQHQFFGRARGPFLNPSAMGIYLTVGLAAALMFWPRVGRLGQLALLGFLVAALGAVFATLTRSAWMGTALALVILIMLTLPRQWTRMLVVGGATIGLLLVTTNWDSLWNLKRDERLDASASAESAELRPLLARMAWSMFLDRPLLGCGYGQYDPERLPYLADRSIGMPVEKTRPYAQHNAFLALLVETGLIGMSLFIVLMVLWVRNAWWLWANLDAPLWVRQTGLLMMLAVATYLPNAMFQDTNIIDGVNTLMFFLAGITSGLVAAVGRHSALLQDDSDGETDIPRFEPLVSC